MAQTALNSGASALQKLNQTFFSLFPHLDLVAKHLLDTLVDFVDHPRQCLLSLFSLLTLLIELVVELANLLREHIDQDLATLVPLLVFLDDGGLDAADLGAESVLVSI